MTTTILLPRIVSPDSGLRFRTGPGYAQGGLYYATYRERAAGKPDTIRLRSLGTADRTEAVAARDSFYEELRGQGAVTARKGGRKKGEPKE